jgi:flagellin
VGADANQTIDVTISDARATALGNYSFASTNATADNGLEVATAAGAAKAANNFNTQAITINGSLGQSTIAAATLADGSTARDIAAAVNNVTGSTGVTATARTTATIGTLSAAGTYAFSLYGQNTTAVAISATISNTSDLTQLRDAINAQSGQTGITATGTGATLTLTQAEGYDIAIEGVSAGGATFNLTGGEGAAATLGAAAGTDSSTVGGEVVFSSENPFTASSSVAAAGGGLFNAAAAASVTGTLSAVGSVSIATQTGANSAIAVLDAALQKLSSIRADLGAVQNRFGSTISNLETTSENLEAARSRVRDADFAAETAALTRGQILQQAGTAILAQANALPNGVLALLRG